MDSKQPSHQTTSMPTDYPLKLLAISSIIFFSCLPLLQVILLLQISRLTLQTFFFHQCGQITQRNLSKCIQLNRNLLKFKENMPNKQEHNRSQNTHENLCMTIVQGQITWIAALQKKAATQNPGREQGENNHQCTLSIVMPGGL